MDTVGRNQKEIFYSLLLLFTLLIILDFSMEMDFNTIVSEFVIQCCGEMQYS